MPVYLGISGVLLILLGSFGFRGLIAVGRGQARVAQATQPVVNTGTLYQ